MKKIITPFLLLLPVALMAQQAPCYFDTYRHTYGNQIQKAETVISSSVANPPTFSRTSHDIKIIPVVVHVIHNGGPENISDAQIQSQIAVLNEDFRKQAGTNGDGNGVDTEIEFCLAQISPDGYCTNGIIRVQSGLTNHLTYQRAQLKQLSYWDNSRYLNMYVVKSINGNSGIAGYSSFPGGPPDEDGIVVRHNYFGTTGTASATLGRTTTHEIAHWFGLYHTFNNGCGTDTCTDGDYVCDTPPVAAPNFGCPSINSCSNDFPDIPDQIENYCDYSDDGCKNMFTEGQKQRMHATLNTFRTLIWSEPNLVGTGCDSGHVSPAFCPPVADFTALATQICVNGNVTFYDRSLNGPSALTWNFPGAVPATSSAPNPTVSYPTTGIFPVTLTVSNPNGNDTLMITNYVTVTTPVTGAVGPWGNGFEDVVFPSEGLAIDNPDNGITWERTTDAAYEGMASARIQNLINTNYGQSDALLLPRIDFSTLAAPIKLAFKWAYARSSPTYSDELIVLVSNDCGNTWTQKFYRTGNALATGPAQTTLFIPDTTQWKSADIDMSSYAADDYVDIKIVNVTDGGNALYIDSLTLGDFDLGILGVESNVNPILLLFPNPVQDMLTVRIDGGQIIEEIRVMDIFGKEVLWSKGIPTNETIIDVGLYPSGVYVIKIKAGGYHSSLRFIRQ